VTRTVVHLVRHGEVDNPAGILYGTLPGFALSADGTTMAEQAASALVGRDVALVWTSPLQRAVQTAEPVAAGHGLTPQPDERLIEPWNAFEGKNFGAGTGALRDPATWWAVRNPLRPSWGEPYEDVAGRMLAAAADARDAAEGREAVLVSHQLPIWVARRRVEGRPLWHRPDRRQCALASITSLIYDDDRVVAVRYVEPAGAASRRRVTSGA
jgi:broad specificity phosphatase PhoE